MRKLSLLAIAVAVALVMTMTAAARRSADAGSPFTIAVYGDAPYGTSNTDTAEFDATPAFITAVNDDPSVSLVAHVGDIHSGSQRCTEAYDQSIATLWSSFADPLVYTPGDNEWSDCQKAKQLAGDPSLSYAGGDPIANLALVRSLFFPHPGLTLGQNPISVVSQGLVGHDTDVSYVENVRWEQSGTLFVTLNLPGGSNNDNDNWFGAARTQAQTDEIAARTDADLHWINAAFVAARQDRVGSIVILEQADMWDVEDAVAGHQAAYEPFVSAIANHTKAFKLPVLLINGDSHKYRSDNPLVEGAPCADEGKLPECTIDAWTHHPFYDVPNFHRIVVHGGTPLPLEYLRLTVDPSVDATASSNAFGPFSWERVQP